MKGEVAIGQIMSEINGILKENNKMYRFGKETGRLLPSKKHKVLHLKLESKYPSLFLDKKSSIIVKLFSRHDNEGYSRWQKEIRNYSLLKKNMLPGKLPKRYDYSEFLIIYEYIKGKEYRELLLDKKLTRNHSISLANWFVALHKQNLIFGDSRLSNFMVSETDELIIIDIEDMRAGNYLEDLKEISSSFLDYNPGIFDGKFVRENFSRLVDFLWTYTQNFSDLDIPFENVLNSGKENHYAFEKWIEIIMAGLKQTAIRRKYSISDQEWEKIYTGTLKILKEIMTKDYP